MKKSFRPKPTDAELQILQILWDSGPTSVRQVNEIMNREKEVGYTTTLKLMQIMAEKGLVRRDTSQRTHIYQPAVERLATQHSLLKAFVEKAFQGSAMKLVMQTLGNHKATKKELSELKKFIEKLEKDK